MSPPRDPIVFRVGGYVLSYAAGIFLVFQLSWEVSSFELMVCLGSVAFLLILGSILQQRLVLSSLWRLSLMGFLFCFGMCRALSVNVKSPEDQGFIYRVGSQPHSAGQMWRLDATDLASGLRWRLYLPDSVSLGEGDVLFATGSVVHPKEPVYPYEFNKKRYYSAKGIAGDVFVRDHHILQRIPQNGFRNGLMASLKQWPVSVQTRSFYRAMLFGDKSDIDPEDKAAFTETGLVHLLAVSGLHVGLVATMAGALFFLPIFKLRPWSFVKSSFVLLAIWTFAWLGGMSPSLLRASILFSLMTLGSLTDRKGESGEAVWMAGFLILLIDPNALYDLGFQLSFCAVFGIVYGHKLTMQYIPTPDNKTGKWLRKVLELGSVSVWAQMATSPITLYHFHQFPNYFLLANWLFLPFVPLLLMSGVAMLMMEMTLPVHNLLWTILDGAVHLFFLGVHFISEMPGAVSSKIYISVYQSVVMTFALIAAILLLAHRKVLWAMIFSVSMALIFIQSNDAGSSGFIHHLSGQTYLEIHEEGRSMIWTSDTAKVDRLLYRSSSWRGSLNIDSADIQQAAIRNIDLEVDTFYPINTSVIPSTFFSTHPSPE